MLWKFIFTNFYKICKTLSSDRKNFLKTEKLSSSQKTFFWIERSFHGRKIFHSFWKKKSASNQSEKKFNPDANRMTSLMYAAIGCL